MLACLDPAKMPCLKALYLAVYDRACTLEHDEMLCLLACLVVCSLLCSSSDEMLCLLATDA